MDETMKLQASLDKFYQYAFPMPTVLITCTDEEGNTNVVTVAWHTSLSRKPPLYGVSLAFKRFSLEIIKKTKEYAVNFISYELMEKAHYCGTHSGRNTDKITDTNLHMGPAQKIQTPLLTDAYANFECVLQQTIPLGDH
ncbi:MAG: flavin reductase family protein, partial [Candidatus Thermoplasmatota archaeon]|nr:flavin reductase family protein [Candidatus Thermoplasmatota archaeon]